MAFTVNRTVAWQAGEGTPDKYVFNLNVTVEVVSLVGNTATISVVGTAGIQNNPLNSRNSFAASDIALLTTGNADPWNYAFSGGTSYYQQTLPFSPNAPQAVVNSILLQFRGDTWRSDPVNSNNRSSLYYKPSGVVLDTYDGDTYQQFNINTTFTINVPISGNTPILVWTTSGANSSTEYNWLEHETWASWFDLNYIPGKIWDGDNWLSHNRQGGTAKIYNGTTWRTMDTIGGGVESGDPPEIYNGTTWKNMRRIGVGG